ncbi:AraC family transcriptional regulator [Paenibacillus sp. N4]|uniref:AraC family transcriptional regulator n=1 Tax=Paenibacillus vietnamensis TaxID=2590547 RepID=UPI001CD0D3AB|nr:AraC family transcriptional regulator [Paenibacillus vietnamensis]MCA0758052.1 AraC family transcriptional regulator [Paenibacillus vietnamensis]
MVTQHPYGVYGYRFQDPPELPIFQLFATGYQRETKPDYYWDGMKRIDGPLYLVQYTVSGQGRFRNGPNVHDMRAGRAFLAEIPGDHHYCLPEESDHWTFYFALFRKRHLERLWGELIGAVGDTPFLEPAGGAVLCLQRLFLEARSNRIHNSYQASSMIYQLMMELMAAGTAPQQERANWPQPVRQAAAFMEAEYGRIQSLDDIAGSVSLSKYYFTRMFTAATGLSPMDYVTKLRIEKAAELLRFTTLSVEEIAARVGYASGSYFSKVFRARVGFPPGDFRLAKGLPSIERLHID